MKILVTGGAGFIGSHLCEKLINLGLEVICIDNLYSGREENIQQLYRTGRFVFKKRDITRKPNYLEGMDRIFHLACPASPVFYQKDPIKTIETNVVGTNNLLKGMEKSSRILLTSTSEVYGDPLEHPQKETYWGNVNPIGIRSCYDEGKRAAETLMFDYNRQLGTDIRVVRIFNTYGPKMQENDGRVVSNFILQAIKGNPITIYGDGSQTRSFCYIDDMVDGLIKMMEQKNTIGPVNFGNPDEKTILELAEIIIRLTESKSKIIYKPLPENDPTRRKPDITKAKNDVNWKPNIELKEGLEKTIKWWRTQ